MKSTEREREREKERERERERKKEELSRVEWKILIIYFC